MRLMATSLLAAGCLALCLAIAGSLDGESAHAALAEAQSSMHPAATGHLPPFITSPGTTDRLMVVMAFVLAVSAFRGARGCTSSTRSASCTQ